MQKNKSRKANFRGFQGIDARNIHSGKESIADINNFRIIEDGSLVKREGYRCIFSNNGTIRDVWSGVINGSFCNFFLCDNSIYSLTVSDEGWGASRIAWLPNNESGPAQFFYYSDALYVSDRSGIYQVTSGSLSPVLGYVPLYGKDWPTSYPGEVNEPLNILNGYARISYKIPSTHTSMLPTKLPVKSVLSLYKNDVLLSNTEYRYDANLMVISVSGLKEGDRLLATVIFDTDFSDSALHSCPYAYVFGGISNSRVFMWGMDKNVIFPSAYVDQVNYNESKRLFPECTNLYFPENSEFVVGDGRYSMKAIMRHYDRMLVFTEGDTWMANDTVTGTEDFPIMNINSSMGCSSNMGAITSGNTPITVDKNNILQWTSDTDERNECNAFSISGPINEYLSSEFFKGATAFNNASKNEVWFHNPGVSDDVWIYKPNKKVWFRFSGILANKFFNANGRLAFIYQGNVYLFIDSLREDIEANFQYKNINASLTLGSLDFDTAITKKLSSYTIDTETDGGSLEISLITDREEKITSNISSEQQRIIKRKRLHSGRFSFLKSITLTTSGSSHPIIRDIEISAR